MSLVLLRVSCVLNQIKLAFFTLNEISLQVKYLFESYPLQSLSSFVLNC